MELKWKYFNKILFKKLDVIIFKNIVSIDSFLQFLRHSFIMDEKKNN